MRVKIEPQGQSQTHSCKSDTDAVNHCRLSPAHSVLAVAADAEALPAELPPSDAPTTGSQAAEIWCSVFPVLLLSIPLPLC